MYQYPVFEIRHTMQDFYINMYEDIFFVVIFGLSGFISQQQFCRLTNDNKAKAAHSINKLLNDWKRYYIISIQKIGRCNILIINEPVYKHFHLCYQNARSANKLKRTTLLMEKYLREGKYYNKSFSSLKERILKTNALWYLPVGQSSYNILNNYEKALMPFHWDTRGIENEKAIMKKYIQNSAKFQKAEESEKQISTVKNLYNLNCQGIFLTGAKIKKRENNKVEFVLYCDILNTYNYYSNILVDRILSARLTLYSIFDDDNKEHIFNPIITIYSHEQHDQLFIDDVYRQLKRTNVFLFCSDQELKDQIRFVYFNSATKLFNGVKLHQLI